MGSTFVFVWRRINRNNWHKKRVLADDLNAAMAGLHVHLSHRSDYPREVVVDHPVQEILADHLVHRHSLTQVQSPFRIEHDNQAYPVGHFPQSTW
ncbi:hypothetical protein [Variovorax sp. GT1P44]|uniref:hypothetical protein n=1 Tax=Variovorax sp. GT1P44 TaxID=3443742 RepID=UPI003F4631F0